jgi:hypothetical protein
MPERRRPALMVEGGTLHVSLRRTVQLQAYEPFTMEIAVDAPLPADRPVDAVATEVIDWVSTRLDREFQELEESRG